MSGHSLLHRKCSLSSHTCKDRRTGRRARDEAQRPVRDDSIVVAHHRHVWVASSSAVARDKCAALERQVLRCGALLPGLDTIHGGIHRETSTRGDG